MPIYRRKQDRLVFSDQECPCEWGWTGNKHMNRTDKIISESDVGLEENKTQPCDGESCQSRDGWPLYSEWSGRLL